MEEFLTINGVLFPGQVQLRLQRILTWWGKHCTNLVPPRTPHDYTSCRMDETQCQNCSKIIMHNDTTVTQCRLCKKWTCVVHDTLAFRNRKGCVPVDCCCSVGRDWFIAEQLRKGCLEDVEELLRHMDEELREDGEYVLSVQEAREQLPELCDRDRGIAQPDKLMEEGRQRRAAEDRENERLNQEREAREAARRREWEQASEERRAQLRAECEEEENRKQQREADRQRREEEWQDKMRHAAEQRRLEQEREEREEREAAATKQREEEEYRLSLLQLREEAEEAAKKAAQRREQDRIEAEQRQQERERQLQEERQRQQVLEAARDAQRAILADEEKERRLAEHMWREEMERKRREEQGRLQQARAERERLLQEKARKEREALIAKRKLQEEEKRRAEEEEQRKQEEWEARIERQRLARKTQLSATGGSPQAVVHDLPSETIGPVAVRGPLAGRPTAPTIINTYPYAHLKLPSKLGRAHIDVTQREAYLSEAEFLEVFKMTRDEFQKLPKHKQQEKKKQVKLF